MACPVVPSNELDFRDGARRPRQTCITGKQRRTQRLGQRNVGSVVRAVIAPQFPNPAQKWRMRVADDIELLKMLESSGATTFVDLAAALVAAQRLRDLQIQ